MTQKIKITHLFAVFVLFISFSACKKDLISVKTEKSYREPQTVSEGEWYTGMVLTLRPNRTATLILGGDAACEGRYDIKGAKLTFKMSTQKEKYSFTIISEQEIHGENGEKLLLDVN
nr:hypothetical protein [Pedobacter panaciterrae]